MTQTRTTYGVILRGCSGAATWRYSNRPTADRVRRVLRAWAAAGGWTGWRTNEAIADYAEGAKGRRTTDVVADCMRINREGRRQ